MDASMGVKYNPGGNQNVQTLANIFPFGQPEPGNYSGAVYFNGRVYYSETSSPMKAFTVTSAKLSASATSQTTTVFGYPGTIPVVSANGTTNGIVLVSPNRPDFEAA